MDKTVEVSQAARELLPCPFCGGEAKVFGPYGWYSQWGISHSCKTFYNGSSEICQGFGSANAAVAAWNTRATQPEAALREALSGLELTEDGSLRVPFDGDVDGDGRHVVVGGETVVTFADSNEGEAVREAVLDFMGLGK